MSLPRQRLMVLLRLTVPPYGPVVVPVWVQLPPAQVVWPLLVTTPPRGPVKLPLWLQLPPPQPPEPDDDHVPPRGPTPPPLRVQACALDAPRAITIAAIAAAAIGVRTDLICLSCYFDTASWRKESLADQLCRRIAEKTGHVTFCNGVRGRVARSREVFLKRPAWTSAPIS
jgi:hypothetical protein